MAKAKTAESLVNQALHIYLQHALESAKAVQGVLEMRKEEELDKDGLSRAIDLAGKLIVTCQNCICVEDGRCLSQHGVYALVSLSRMEDALLSHIVSIGSAYVDEGGVCPVSLYNETAAKFYVNALIAYRRASSSLGDMWQFAAGLCDTLCISPVTVKKPTTSSNKVLKLYRYRTQYDHLLAAAFFSDDARSIETALQPMRFQREAWACGTIVHLLRVHRDHFPWNAEKLEAAYNRKRKLAISLARHSASLIDLNSASQSSADPLERQVREAALKTGQYLVGLFEAGYEGCVMPDEDEVAEAEEVVEILRGAAESVAEVIAVLRAFEQDSRLKPAEAAGTANRTRRYLEEAVAGLLAEATDLPRALGDDNEALGDAAARIGYLRTCADPFHRAWPCLVAYRRSAEEASKGSEQSPAQKLVAATWQKAADHAAHALESLPADGATAQNALHHCRAASDLVNTKLLRVVECERRIALDAGRLSPQAKDWLEVRLAALMEFAEFFVGVQPEVNAPDILFDIESFGRAARGALRAGLLESLAGAALRSAAAWETADADADDSANPAEAAPQKPFYEYEFTDSILTDEELVASLPKHLLVLRRTEGAFWRAAVFPQPGMYTEDPRDSYPRRLEAELSSGGARKPYQLPSDQEELQKTLVGVRNLLLTRDLCAALAPAPGAPAQLSVPSPGPDTAHAVMCGWLAQQAVLLQEWVLRLVREDVYKAPAQRLVWQWGLEVRNVLQLALKWRGGSGDAVGEEGSEEEVDSSDSDSDASEAVATAAGEDDDKGEQRDGYGELRMFDPDGFPLSSAPSSNSFEGSRRVAMCLNRALWEGINGNSESVPIYEAAAWYLSPEARGALSVDDATVQYITSSLTAQAVHHHNGIKGDTPLLAMPAGLSLSEEARGQLDALVDAELQHAEGYSSLYNYHPALYRAALASYRDLAKHLMAAARQVQDSTASEDPASLSATKQRQHHLRCAADFLKKGAATCIYNEEVANYIFAVHRCYQALYLSDAGAASMPVKVRGLVAALYRRNLRAGERLRQISLDSSADYYAESADMTSRLLVSVPSEKRNELSSSHCPELETIALLMEAVALAKDRVVGVTEAALRAGLEGELQEGLAEVEALAGRWQTKEAVGQAWEQLRTASDTVRYYCGALKGTVPYSYPDRTASAATVAATSKLQLREVIAALGAGSALLLRQATEQAP